MKTNMKRITKNPFTLIELMVVIGIIIILVSLVTMKIGGAMDKGNALGVRLELKAIAEASKAYEQMYGELPDGLGSSTGLDTMVKILKADSDECDSSDDTKNPKRRRFLDSKLFKKLKDDGSGDYEDAHHFDFWGYEVELGGSGPYYLVSPGPDGVPQTTNFNSTITTTVVEDWQKGDDVLFIWE